MGKVVYNILSPDGFALERETVYKTPKAALQAFTGWVNRYKSQGYYSSNKGRIELSDLVHYCKFITSDEEGEFPVFGFVLFDESPTVFDFIQSFSKNS